MLSVLIGENTSDLTPTETAIVVITDAATKYKINIGKICFNDTCFCPSLFFSLRERRKASTKVIGIIASVRVSFTVTAVSSVALPSPHIVSQVEAAAVTDEVSFTAVPAKIPNASPVVVLNPSSFPNVGKKIAASTLKKKITEIACATSSSSASITGAVAAIAEPPQIDEPTPTKVEILPGICITLHSTKAMTSEMVIVLTIIGSDCFPVSTMTCRFKPKPSSTTAHCRIFFDVNLIPASNGALFLRNIAITMPAMIAITAPPIIGNMFPKNHDGTAMHRQIKIPFQFFVIKFIFCTPYCIEN